MNTTGRDPRSAASARQCRPPAPGFGRAKGKAPGELLALWNEWDPVGDFAAPVPADRYRPYVSPSMRMLEASAPQHELARYVEWVVADRLGLGTAGASRVDPDAFATLMKRWYAAG